MTILAVTGHRPHLLGGYTVTVQGRAVRLAREALEAHRPAHVLTGMALGWDQAVAEAAIKLGIPFTAAIPFEGFDSRWPRHVRDRFNTLCAQAHEVVLVTPGDYAPRKLELRNRWMVNRCDHLLALWSGKRGGTRNTIIYARRHKVEITQLWERWLEICDDPPRSRDE